MSDQQKIDNRYEDVITNMAHENKALQAQLAVMRQALERIRERERITNAGSKSWSLANEAIAQAKGGAV